MSAKEMAALKQAVDRKRREISSDNISMSVGELLNLYKDEELDIHPEFQRVFRWQSEQKSRLIESLLLGIPLPPIYVATNDRGIWEVIDGVQRLSTIFEFMGELKGPQAEKDDDQIVELPPFVPSGTKHLPELDRAAYKMMDQTLKLEIKRARLDVKVLSRGSEKGTSGKFDLFERLNTYGQPLSPQELRNCILVSLNPTMFRWLSQLSKYEHFVNCTTLSESQLLERYDMDLALRFIVLRRSQQISGDIHEHLRDAMESIATDQSFDFKEEEKIFKRTFKRLDESVGSNSFRSWSKARGEFRGGFTLAAFEGISLSITKNWGEIARLGERFSMEEYVKAVWQQSEYTRSFSGLRARERMARVVPAAERVAASMLKAAAKKNSTKR